MFRLIVLKSSAPALVSKHSCPFPGRPFPGSTEAWEPRSSHAADPMHCTGSGSKDQQIAYDQLGQPTVPGLSLSLAETNTLAFIFPCPSIHSAPDMLGHSSQAEAKQNITSDDNKIGASKYLASFWWCPQRRARRPENSCGSALVLQIMFITRRERSSV